MARLSMTQAEPITQRVTTIHCREGEGEGHDPGRADDTAGHHDTLPGEGGIDRGSSPRYTAGRNIRGHYDALTGGAPGECHFDILPGGISAERHQQVTKGMYIGSLWFAR